MAVATYTHNGSKATTNAKLDKSIFSMSVSSHELLKQAYVAYLANGRRNLAKTKTRGEVIGSNIKPWRQKGTGRARFGSRYNPIWRGGGITFGPTGQENYSHKLNVKAKRQAIRQALSLANEASKVAVLEKFDPKDGKTSAVVSLLNKIGATGNILMVVEDKTDNIRRATGNIPTLIVTQTKYVNVYDVMNADKIIITQKALDQLHEWLVVAKPAKIEEAK